MMKFWAILALALPARAIPPTWGPTNHSPYITVTQDTATRNSTFGGGWVIALSDLSQNSGIHTVYFYVGQVGTQVEVGVVNAVGGSWVGQHNGIGYQNNGNVQVNGLWAGVAPLPPPFTTGDTLGMQVDFGARTVKFNKNGGSWSGAIDTTPFGPDLYVATSLLNTTPFASVQILPASDWGGPVLNFVAAGDSITQGGGAKLNYVPRLAALLSAQYGEVSWTRAGINSVTWNYAAPSSAGYPYTLMQDAPVRVDPERVSDIPSWLIAFAGTNGLASYHRSAAQECADAQTYITGRVAAGQDPAKIILPAMLPRTGVDEGTRSSYNACLRTLGYIVAPLDLDPNIGCSGCNLNPTYFLDGVHPTDAGAAIVAQIIQSVMP